MVIIIMTLIIQIIQLVIQKQKNTIIKNDMKLFIYHILFQNRKSSIWRNKIEAHGSLQFNKI